MAQPGTGGTVEAEMAEEGKAFTVSDPDGGLTLEIGAASMEDLQRDVTVAFRQPGYLTFKRPGGGAAVMVTPRVKFENLPSELEWKHQPQGAATSSGQAGAGAVAGAAAGIDSAAITSVMGALLEDKLEDKLAPIRQALERHASSTVAASSITYEELAAVRDSVGAKIIFTCDGDEDPGEVLTKLLSASPGKIELFWEDPPEPSQRSRYSKHLKDNVPTPRRFTWVDARGVELKMHVRGESFKLASKNDELCIIRGYRSEPALGAVLGVEAKKALTHEGLRQAEAEFYVFARYSMFPYAQVITDFTTGGVVFYSDRDEHRKVHVTVHTLEGMPTLFAFMTTMLQSIPDKTGDRTADDAHCMPAELLQPKRIKPTTLSQPLSCAEALKLLCGLQGYDIACEEDLEGFDLPRCHDFGRAETPSYIH